MTLIEELLNPVSDAAAGGLSLRYDPVYDKIKEARREDEEVPQGDWTRELKRADWPLVIKLCSESIASRSKDLQLAAWLTEALIHKRGFEGLREGILLCRELLEKFWDVLLPAIEDGDLELRAGPLEWVGRKLNDAIRNIALTRNGLSYLKYKESRSVGSEAEAEQSEQKKAARDEAISDGKLTAEEFDEALAATPKQFYIDTLASITACIEGVNALTETSRKLFGDFAPSFTPLRETLEEIAITVKVFLRTKQDNEPAEEASSGERSEVAGGESSGDVAGSETSVARSTANALVTSEPADREDGCRRIATVCSWLRQEDRANPVPYLVLRALRWGELRAGGNQEIDGSALVPPPTQVRTHIKELISAGSFDELLEAVEDAMANPWGRGWLDLQRYFHVACDGIGGLEAVRDSVAAELKTFLAELPELSRMTFLDDTPTANPETLKWIEEICCTSAEESSESEPMRPAPAATDETPQATSQPDVFAIADEAIRSGHPKEAIGMLARDIAQERNGRRRFKKQVHLAEICMSSGQLPIAKSILEVVAADISRHQLEEWEAPEVLSHPLALLYRCLAKTNEDEGHRQELYARICRLDPAEALLLKV